jgi:hypothetical protein
MNYWNAMRDKWGFDDGDSEPREGCQARAAYVTAVNALAESYGSAYRAVAFNRDGVHNHCMVLVLPASALAGLTFEDLAWDDDGKVLKLLREKVLDEGEDEAFGRAVDTAMDMTLDDLVEGEPRLSASLEQIREMTTRASASVRCSASGLPP